MIAVYWKSVSRFFIKLCDKWLNNWFRGNHMTSHVRTDQKTCVYCLKNWHNSNQSHPNFSEVFAPNSCVFKTLLITGIGMKMILRVMTAKPLVTARYNSTALGSTEVFRPKSVRSAGVSIRPVQIYQIILRGLRLILAVLVSEIIFMVILSHTIFTHSQGILTLSAHFG